MTAEDEFNLFDALLGVHMEWEAVLAGYRERFAGLVRDGLAVGSVSPSAARGALCELDTLNTAIEQLSRCAADVEVELARAEEQRVTRHYQWVQASTAPAAQGDEVPDTSTRASGAAGPRTRSESGQRKGEETPF